MKLLVRVLVVLLVAGLGVMGAGFLLDPVASAEFFAVDPIGNQGLNTLRADFGALFLGSALLLLIGLLPGKSGALQAVAVLMAVAAAGRITGFVLDGASRGTLLPLAVELFMVVFLPFAASCLRRAQPG